MQNAVAQCPVLGALGKVHPVVGWLLQYDDIVVKDPSAEPSCWPLLQGTAMVLTTQHNKLLISVAGTWIIIY